jgi:predicted kinase
MTSGRIVIVSGPPGAGKSTVAQALAEQAEGPLAVHLHTDDFYAYIRKGWVPMWEPQSLHQNTTVMRALASSAATFAEGGYEVAVDGIVGPWFFEPWREAAVARGVDLHYVCLLPSEAETVARGTARTAPGAMTDPAVITQMWQAFHQRPSPPANVFDTTGETTEATTARVRAALASGGLKLG